MATKKNSDKGGSKKVRPKKEAKKTKKKKVEKDTKIVKAPKAPKAEFGEADLEKILPHTGEEVFADLREAVLRQRDAIDSARWNLAEALFRVNDDAVYLQWGYPSWETYIATEVGMTARTAHYLIAMYGYFTVSLIEAVSGMSESDPKRIEAIEKRNEIIGQIKELGWTKGKCLVGVLTLDNYEEWIEKAKSLSATELEGESKRALNTSKGLSSTDVEVMKNASFRFAEDQLAVVEQAIEMASAQLESDKRGHVLSMICQDYVATNMAQSENGQSKSGRYFDRLGTMFGVRLIAVHKETGKVVHGETLLKDLMKGE